MPSFPHEILVDLCRQSGGLVRALLHLRGIVPAGTRADLGSIDLSQVVPTEYRADAVTVFRDAEAARAAVVLEVQLYEDPAKRRSWPVYVAALRASLRCPVYLLVLTPDPAIARWARTPIDLGHPGFRLVPIVLELADLPRITDPDVARRLPELAVLSVQAHPDFEVARTALGALAGLPEEQTRLYLDLILAAVPDQVRRPLEQLMIKGYEYQSEFARKYYGQGLAEGVETGRAQGRAQGLEAGRAQALQDAVLELARARLPRLSPERIAALRALRDEAALRALLGALARTTTPAGTRAALRRAGV